MPWWYRAGCQISIRARSCRWSRSSTRRWTPSAEASGFEIAVTGLSAIAARNSANMIEKLNPGLTIEFAARRRLHRAGVPLRVVMFACILPGIFPVVMSGTVLWLLGEGLQFASVVALTVSFGLGLSATIHFLNRLRLERRRHQSGAGGRACDRAGRAGADPDHGGAGLRPGGDGVFRPAVAALFGWLSAFAMVAALVADLFILRPTAMWLINLSQRLRGTIELREAKNQTGIGRLELGAGSLRARSGRLHRMTKLRPSAALGHRDVDAADFALGTDLHDLLVAVVRKLRLAANPQPRRKRRSGRRRRCPADCRKYSGSFRSSCRKCDRHGWSLAAEVELVAVAGATKARL